MDRDRSSRFSDDPGIRFVDHAAKFPEYDKLPEKDNQETELEDNSDSKEES